MNTDVLRNAVLSLVVIGFAVIGAAAQSVWTSQRLNAKGDLVAVYFTGSDKGWVAGDGGYLAQTTDGGRTWTQYPLPTDEDINEIYFRNDDNGYLVVGKKMFITRDAGKSWQEIRIYRTGEFGTAVPEFLSIRFTDKKRGYIIGSITRGDIVVDSLLMRSDDGGDTWRRINLPVKSELFDLDFSGNSHGWIVGDKGVVLATTDEGMTWSIQSSGVNRALFNVDFRDDDNGYAVGGGGTVIRTEDGGRNWTRVITAFPDTFKRVDFADDKNGWIVGYGGSILRSSDRGKTWVRQDSGTRERLYGLFMDKKYGWAVGEKGLILKYKK
jgi:photosystem II stability/assembly factor-like uncharacterized protein